MYSLLLNFVYIMKGLVSDMNRGKLIVIEGTDGSGKQTQSEKLFDRLNSKGIDCEIIGFPNYGSATGDIIGDCCLGKDNRIKGGSWFENFSQLDPKIACLYYAADRLSMASVIREKLVEGKVVILDRYVESNMGHQCGKLLNKSERNKLRDWIVNLEYKLLKLPQPDLIIFLHMPFQLSRKLKEGMDEKLDAHEADENHLRNAENAYLELADHYGWNKIKCFVDSNVRNIDDIGEEVYRVISQTIF